MLGPNLVGATGGSGTRVVARILRQAGLFIGDDLNESEDAIALGEYSDRWINRYLSYRASRLPAVLEHEMLDDLALVLRGHCRPLEHARTYWGWKEPRCIYLLPFFRRHFSSLRFLHVIRDGRDMALSSNQNQLRKHAAAAGIPQDLPEAVRSIALWRWINRETAAYGEQHLGARYLRIRFEDLCAAPTEVATALLSFFELDDGRAGVPELVSTPLTIGRWRHADHQLVADLERVAGDALAAFGYELSQ